MVVVASWLRLFVPTMQGIPSSRLTIEAWQVIPPASVTMALAFFMAGTQSGAVMVVTRISPSLNSAIFAGSRMTWALPAACPGLAGRPFTKMLRSVVMATCSPLSVLVCFFSLFFLDHTVSGRAWRSHSLFVRSSTPHSISM